MYRFKLGERKIVGIKVYSNDGKSFLVNDANYYLIKSDTQVVESSGKATINDNTISAVISPLSIGNYILKLEFDILPEKLIEEIQIKVD